MSLDLYLAFVAATLVMILIPGPNVALIVANSVAHGTRYGLLTVAGTTAAMIPQLAVTILGLSAMLAAMAHGFEYLRWAGVAYLVWLGLRTWFAAPTDLSATQAQPANGRRIFATGFLVSLTNPKTLLFYGAFMPQFVSLETGRPGLQLLVLAATFVVMAACGDSVWALLAGRFRHVLQMRGRLRNRITGTLLIGAGLGLALARKS
jgi:homoserine/homoserine lactone efflux protein